MVHESSLYENNCFITLTYDNDHLPEDNSLNKKHFQDFMKRLRKKYSHKIRFYHCGEYGDQTFRPHYHAIIFNHNFSDKTLFSERKDIKLYISEDLQKLWPFGFSTIGDVTFDSAAYCARYVMKKRTGQQSKQHYERLDQDTGEIIDLLPEYNTMSRRPGIASDWFKKWGSDVYPSDTIAINGKTVKPPKFYDTMFEHLNPDAFLQIKKKRQEKQKLRASDNTPERLAVKEIVKKAQLKQLIRTL